MRQPNEHLDGSKVTKDYVAEPGSYQAGKNFGEGLNNVVIGAPYKFVPKEGPGPGEYRAESPLTKSRARECFIREDII